VIALDYLRCAFPERAHRWPPNSTRGCKDPARPGRVVRRRRYLVARVISSAG